MAELFHVVPEDQFSGHQNVSIGNRAANKNTRSGVTVADWMRRFKSGTATASGAGTVAVTFAEEFPDDNVVVMLTSDENAAGTLTAATMPTKTGFTITAAAAGTVHWLAVWAGPSS